MAGKNFQVGIDVNVGNSVEQINKLLTSLTAVKNVATDLQKGEVAINVVVRNKGFTQAINAIQASLNKLDTTPADELGKKMASSLAQSRIQITQSIGSINTAFEGLSKTVEEVFDGKGGKTGLTNLSSAVRRGISDSLKSLNTEIKNAFKEASGSSAINKLSDSFANFYDKLIGGVGDSDESKTLIGAMKQMSNNMSNEATKMRQISREMTENLSKLNKENIDIAVKLQKYDKLSARDKREQGREDTKAEWAEKRALRQEERDEKFRKQELRQKQKHTDSIIKLNEKRTKHEEAATNREIAATQRELTQKQKLDLQLEELEKRKAIREKLIAEQVAAIKEYGNEADLRDKDRNSTEEKYIALKRAELHVLEQIRSTERGNVVSVHAIQAAADKRRQSELDLQKHLFMSANKYEKIKESTEKTVKNLKQVGTAMQRVSSLVSSVSSMFSNMRQWATSMGNALVKAGQTGMQYATQAARTISSAAFDQYSKLETARIGFENFFGKQSSDRLVKRVQQEAIKAPGLNTGDLADYVRQLAPVSGGNADTALNAALGMLKTIQYGGAEGSEEMEYVIKNVRDVISKGKATAIDLRQFNRAMPILEDVLGKVGKSDFIKNGKLNITKQNAKDILQAFADVNTDPSSPVSSIYDKIGNTLSGLIESIKESFTTGLNNTLVDLGVYEKIREVLKEIRDGGVLEDFFTWLGNTVGNIVDMLSRLDWGKIKDSTISGISKIWSSIVKAARSIMSALGASDIGSFIEKIASLIAKFIEGWTEGIKQIISVVDWAQKNIDADILNKAATFFGTIASPFGRLIQTAFGFVQNIANLASRGALLFSDKLASGLPGRLSKIEEMAANPETALAYQEFLQASIPARLNLSGKQLASMSAKEIAEMMSGADAQLGPKLLTEKGSNIYGKLKTNGKTNMVVYNPKGQKITTWNGVTGAGKGYTESWGEALAYYRDGEGWSSVGGLENMKFWDKMNALGGGYGIDQSGFKGTMAGAGYRAKGFARYTMPKIKNLASKTLKAAGTFAVGEAITGIASSIASAVGGKDLGQTVGMMGDALSATIAIGKQFGPLAGVVGGAAMAFKDLMDVTNELKKAQEEAARAAYEASVGSAAMDVVGTVMDNLKAAGLYEAYNKYDQTAYDTMVDAAKRAVQQGMSPEETVTQVTEAYLLERSKQRSAASFNAWGESREYGSNTAIDAVRDAEKIKQIYDNAIKMHWFDEAGQEITTGQEYLNYLEKRGLTIDSVEQANDILAETGKLMGEYFTDNSLKLKIKPLDGTNEFENWDEWANAMGWVKDGNNWVTNLDVVMNLKSAENMSSADLQRKAAIEAQRSGDWLGSMALFGLEGANRFGSFFAGKWGAGFSNGGRIRPIYRADGGDLPSRGVDTVPVMAQPGEFIMRKSAVSRLGLGLMNALNYGDVSAASRLLSGKVSNSWNNSRNYTHNNVNNSRVVNNYVSVTNRNHRGTLASYNTLANRLALGY